MSRIIEVIIGLKRNIAMAVASIVLIFLTLFILGFSVIIMANIHKISSDIIESLSVYVYIETDVTKEEEEDIIQQVKELDGVKKVTLSDKEEQLNQVTEIWGKDGEMFREYFSGDKNPLNDVLEAEAIDENVDLNELTIQIETIPGVEDADYGEGQGADSLISALKKIQIGANAVTIVFAFITVFLIINTIKLTINSRKRDIEIMRLVGATKTYIMFPFAIEGMILGLIGGLVAFGFSYLIYDKIYSSAGIIAASIVSPSNVMNALIIAQVLFGVIIGFSSAVIAIRSYLKI